MLAPFALAHAATAAGPGLSLGFRLGAGSLGQVGRFLAKSALRVAAKRK
jgi:hypothetical protein